MKQSDGKVRIGILMLDTRFPRPPGDIGHPDSFRRYGAEPIYQKVPGATAHRVVEAAAEGLLEPFISAGRQLVAQGAKRIGTSCGFLARFQSELQQALAVPVISSALLACADSDRPGVLTFSAESLDGQLLAAAGVPPGTPIEGVSAGCEFHRRIMNDEPTMNWREAEQNVVEAAMRLVSAHPAVRTIVLECTNMPVFQSAIEAATGRPTVDLVRLLTRAN